MAGERDGIVVHATQAESGGMMVAAAFPPEASLLLACISHAKLQE
jgi:hypothetical protein